MSGISRWKPFAVLAAVLGLGVVATGIFLQTAQKRTPFVGAADPASGLRCRCLQKAATRHRKDNRRRNGWYPTR